MKINIAIDGPSSAGKSTIAKAIAKKLGLIHIDTGAMYRACALAIMEAKINPEDTEALQKLLDAIVIDFDSCGHVLLNGIDVSKQIRNDVVSMKTSEISSIGIVRKKLVSLQQKIASKKGYILDGRDIGTVVLPDADVKIYMVASAECRAKRRYDEYVKQNQKVDYQEIYDSIVKRDYQDTHRKISPLKKADDAIELDTSNLSVDEVVAEVTKIIDDKLKK